MVEYKFPHVNSAINRLQTEVPQIFEYAETLGNKISTNHGWIKFLKALYINCILTNETFYLDLYAASYHHAVNKGVNLTDISFPDISTKLGQLSVSENKVAIAEAKSRGDISGFWHGHFRALTPGIILAGVIASENCDSLTVGYEEGWRTNKFKGAPLIYEGKTRALAFLSSGIADHVIAIGRETEYSDQGYTDLVRTLSPNKYFVSLAHYPSEVRYRYQQRIQNTDIELVEIPEIPSFSTSQYLSWNLETQVSLDLLKS